MRGLRWLAPAIVMAATAAQAAPDCRTSPVYRARLPCFSVRGRLSVWNGAPTFRLRPAGTKRLLGVVGGDGDAASATVLPPTVRAAMTPPTPGELRSIVGVFRVCPLAPERAGRMRPVCLASASGIAPAPSPDPARR